MPPMSEPLRVGGSVTVRGTVEHVDEDGSVHVSGGGWFESSQIVQRESEPACERCENAKGDPMGLYFCAEHGTNYTPPKSEPQEVDRDGVLDEFARRGSDVGGPGQRQSDPDPGHRVGRGDGVRAAVGGQDGLLADRSAAVGDREGATGQVEQRGSEPSQPIDWSRFPKLASIFQHRPRVNVYWRELETLLNQHYLEGVADATEREVDEQRRQNVDLAKTRAAIAAAFEAIESSAEEGLTDLQRSELVLKASDILEYWEQRSAEPTTHASSKGEP